MNRAGEWVRLMPRRTRCRTALTTVRVCSLLVFAVFDASAPARAANGFDDHEKGGTAFAVSRFVIAGGGGRSSAATFAITGTIGQADADPLQPSTGGVFAISGGFWPGQALPTPPGDQVFANGFEPVLP